MQTASRSESSTLRLGRLLPFAAALGLVALAAVPPGRLNGLPILCPIRRITGLPCPTCGMTRSWNAALRLDVSSSIRHHPVGIVALASTLVALSGADPRARLTRAVEGAPAPVKLLAAAAWIGWWLRRLRAARA
jgi:hypothetical protein